MLIFWHFTQSLEAGSLPDTCMDGDPLLASSFKNPNLASV